MKERSIPDTAGQDAAVAPYLAWIDRRIAAHPEDVQPLDQEWLDRARALVADVPVDLEADLGDASLP